MATSINLIPGQSRPQVHCSQYDLNRRFELDLYEAGEEYTIPAGTRVVIHGTRSDGLGVPDIEAVYSGSRVQFDSTEQLTAVAGVVTCEAVLFWNTQRVGTANFDLVVEKAAKAANAIDAEEDEIRSMAQQIEDAYAQAIEAIASANTSAEEAKTAASESAGHAEDADNFASLAATAAELAASYDPDRFAVDIRRLRNFDELDPGYVWATTEEDTDGNISGWVWDTLTAEEVVDIWEEVMNA